MKFKQCYIERKYEAWLDTWVRAALVLLLVLLECQLYLKTQPVPRSKHYISVIKTSQLMLYREIIAVCSQIHTKYKYSVGTT